MKSKNREFNKFDDFIISKKHILKERMSDIVNKMYEMGGKFTSLNSLNDILFKFWVSSKEDFFLKEGNEEYAAYFLFLCLSIDLEIKSYFMEVIENQENRFFANYFVILDKIFDSENRRKLEPQEELTSFSARLNILRKILDGKEYNGVKLNVMYVNEVSNLIKEFEPFYNFRNKVVHTENKMYHFITSFSHLKIENKAKEDSIKQIKKASNFIINELTSNDTLDAHIQMILSDLIKGINLKLNSREAEIIIISSVNYYANIVNDFFKLDIKLKK